MGLITGLLTLPLAPVRGVVWVSEQIAETAEREMYGPAALRSRLAALNQELEAGEISQEIFEREEERLLDALEAHRPPR
ncbi:gas vesicle protein GvpG [Streptomyces sp. ICBB 8177]|uniref:gas vesicle protein GvpG n=1 Tax=Streptomyces sp. ICBB 8177 TaxID=563922 RepID=UPI000D684D1C|nr:gas vesicle protein GvpG [Streptomyces sp. ICBB 8177]PWI40890.1 gas vesicle protein [Streptomyces sp. ICBB 8177]